MSLYVELVLPLNRRTLMYTLRWCSFLIVKAEVAEIISEGPEDHFLWTASLAVSIDCLRSLIWFNMSIWHHAIKSISVYVFYKKYPKLTLHLAILPTGEE